MMTTGKKVGAGTRLHTRTGFHILASGQLRECRVGCGHSRDARVFAEGLLMHDVSMNGTRGWQPRFWLQSYWLK